MAQFHDELNPVIWNKEELKPEVKTKLKEIASAFIEFLEIPKEAIVDTVITGSSASYNYTKHSDIDLHIIVDPEKVHKDCPIVGEYLLSKKNEFNQKHDIYIYGVPVEVYSETKGQGTVHNGLYSLNTGWIDFPQKIEPTTNDMAVKAKYDEFIESIKGIKEGDLAEKLLEKIKKMRKAGLAEGGEFSVENLVFKKLRDNGYIERLMKVKKEDYDKKLSLEEALEVIENIMEKWGNNSGRYTNGTFGINDDSEDKAYVGNKTTRSVDYKDREMSPDQYIKSCAHLFSRQKKCKKNFVNKVESNRAKNRDKIEKYKQMISSDTEQIDRPYIDYQAGQQEGLHRAIAAKELGHKTIPVRVFHSTDKGCNKLFRRGKKKLEEALDLLEEIATGIAGMMDAQPNPLAGSEQPSKYEKQGKKREKKAQLGYKYKKVRGKAEGIKKAIKDTEN